jgi:hypothetical protein
VRYWAAGARPGADTIFEPSQMKVGRRLASRFSTPRASPSCRRSRKVQSPSRSIAACSRRFQSSSRRVRDLEAYEYVRRAAEDREVLLGVLRRLPRAGEVAALR